MSCRTFPAIGGRVEGSKPPPWLTSEVHIFTQTPSLPSLTPPTFPSSSRNRRSRRALARSHDRHKAAHSPRFPSSAFIVLVLLVLLVRRKIHHVSPVASTSQSGQMEGSAGSPVAASPAHYNYPQLISKSHRVRRPSIYSRKRARLQPRPRSASMSRPSMQLDPSAGEFGKATDISPVPATGRPRRTTVQSDIQETILHPGNVRINVQGAFIVVDEPVTPHSEEYEHDPKDIRLPNHTAVVSHIAVDVSMRACMYSRVSRDHRLHLATGSLSLSSLFNNSSLHITKTC